MKPAVSKAIIKNCRDRGYIEHNGVLYPPLQAAKLGIDTAKKPAKKTCKGIKTGWIDDTRNIRNKEQYTDEFIRLMKVTLNLDIWPEFYFHTVRGFRIDYALPLFNGFPVKIAIEQEGGIFMEKSGHNTGIGIRRDMEKNNLLILEGWTLIRREPKDMNVNNCAETVRLIESLCKGLSVNEIS